MLKAIFQLTASRTERRALRVNIGSDVANARPPGDAAHHNPCLAFGPRIQTLGISVLFVVAGQCRITPSFVNKCFDLIKGASMQAEPRS